MGRERRCDAPESRMSEERSVTGCATKPTMHEDYAIGTPVEINDAFSGYPRMTGTITGVAMSHIFFTYIVTLDVPMGSPHEGWTTVAVPGQGLQKQQGPVEVTINGRDALVPVMFSYEKICEHCGLNPAHNPSVVWSVRGGGNGILSHGESVRTRPGMSIDAMVTGNA